MKHFIIIVMVGFLYGFWLSFPAFSAELGIDVFGLSYHHDRKNYKGESFNEFNPGLGLNCILLDKRKVLLFADSGYYKDSLANWAQFLTVGARYKIIPALSLGLGLTYFKSRSYNRGDPALGPIPILSYRYKMFSLNTVFLPKYKDVNQHSAFGFFGTIHLYRFHQS